ncbi:hypothetical protein [Arthrobacter globiformis]|uniref:hypothetical protein n=1 Tax=Arthrobacter globiformis TaxID=1665 RepID=UPI00167CD280|nr:hypothetical protein [Arthrobacter globiformis]
MTNAPKLPKWALQRVSAYLDDQSRGGEGKTDPLHLAQRTGMSKSLARLCLRELQQRP